MLLEVLERFQLVQMLPAEGKYEALKTIRRQRESLSFEPEEIKLLGITSNANPDGSVATTWDGTKASLVVKDIPIDEYMTNFFRKKLAGIEEEGKLSENLVSLYEKFVVIGFK